METTDTQDNASPSHSNNEPTADEAFAILSQIKIESEQPPTDTSGYTPDHPIDELAAKLEGTADTKPITGSYDLSELSLFTAVSVLDQYAIRILSTRPTFEFYPSDPITRFECEATINHPRLQASSRSGPNATKKNAKAEASLMLCKKLESLGELDIFRKDPSKPGIYDFSRRTEKRARAQAQAQAHNQPPAYNQADGEQHTVFMHNNSIHRNERPALDSEGQSAPKRQRVVEPIRLTIDEESHATIVSHMKNILRNAPDQQLLMSDLGNQLYSIPAVSAIAGKPKLKTLIKVNPQHFEMLQVGPATVHLKENDEYDQTKTESMDDEGSPPIATEQPLDPRLRQQTDNLPSPNLPSPNLSSPNLPSPNLPSSVPNPTREPPPIPPRPHSIPSFNSTLQNSIISAVSLSISSPPAPLVSTEVMQSFADPRIRQVLGRLNNEALASQTAENKRKEREEELAAHDAAFRAQRSARRQLVKQELDQKSSTLAQATSSGDSESPSNVQFAPSAVANNPLGQEHFLPAEHNAPTLLSVPWQVSPKEPALFHTYNIQVPHISENEFELALLTVVPLPLTRMKPIQLYTPGSPTPYIYEITYTGQLALTLEQIEKAKKWQVQALNVVFRRSEPTWTETSRYYLLLPVKRRPGMGISTDELGEATSTDIEDPELAVQWERLKQVIPESAQSEGDVLPEPMKTPKVEAAAGPLEESPWLCTHFMMDRACEDHAAGKCRFQHRYNLPAGVPKEVFELLPHTQSGVTHALDFYCISCHSRLLPAPLIQRLNDGRIYVRPNAAVANNEVHQLQIEDPRLRDLMVSPTSMKLDDQKLLVTCSRLRKAEEAVNIAVCCGHCGLRNGDIIVPAKTMPLMQSEFAVGLAAPYVVRLYHHNPFTGRFHMFPIPAITGQTLDDAVNQMHLVQHDPEIPLLSEWRGFKVDPVSDALQCEEIAWDLMSAESHVLSLSDFKMPNCSLAHCIIMTPYNGLTYLGQSLSTLNAGSPFPGGKAESFAAHFKYKYSIDTNPDDPMIDVQRFTGAGVDFTHPQVRLNSRDANHSMRLLPDYCVVMGAPASVYFLYQACTSFMYEIERQLLLEEAQYHLAFPSDTDMLDRALTCANVSATDNLERLEFLGDCALKFYASLAVFQVFPSDSESVLTREREKVINNLALSESARHGGWLRFARLCRFHPKSLPMPGFAASEPTNLENQSLVFSTKIQADITEAIIGACYESRGDRGIKMFMARLNVQCEGIQQEWAELLHQRDYQFSPVRPPLIVRSSLVDPEFRLPTSPHDQWKIPPGLKVWLEMRAPRIQSVLGYQFTQIEWLIQACVHGSVLQDKSYQYLNLPYYGSERLEFMGDALIDRITTDYLYETMGENASPGDMTIERQKLVSNATFARLTIKKQFHHAMLSVSEPLFNVVEEFENELRSVSSTDQLRTAPKALADLLEAIFGAVLMDSGSFESVNRVWHKIIQYRWNDKKTIAHIDFS